MRREYIVPILVLAVAAIIFLGSVFRVGAAAPPAFDHSDCQYPLRASNPPDGCDNSDPARPECMKFGLEDCDLPEPSKPEPTPASTENVAPAASHDVEIPYIPPETGK